MRRCLPAIAAALFYAAGALGDPSTKAPAPAKAPLPAPASSDLVSSANVPLPQRERDYIALIDKARKQYAASRSVDARKNARLNLQIATHDFMGLSHSAEDWVGIFKNSKQTHEGTLTVQIEVAPGVTISTWDNSDVDASSGTLLKPYLPLGKIVAGLAIGDTVRFSANLLGSVVSTDDDMVLHPQIIAQFRALTKLDDSAARR